MSSQSPIPVLIAGAGPSGLVLALTLLKNGIPVRIIDKELNYHIGQRGAGISPRSQELYNHLGVLPDISARALPSPLIRMYKLPGGVEPHKTFPTALPVDATPSTPYPNMVILGQSSAESILRDHLDKYNCHVELGVELRAFEQHADHVVAHIVKKVEGKEVPETVAARWLVGTDGARGVVRKQLGLSFPGETRGPEQHFLIGDVQVLKGLDREHWHMWGDFSTQLMSLRPTNEEDTFALYAGGQMDLDKLVSDRDELLKFLRSSTTRDDIKLGQIRWISAYRPNIRMVDRFGEGRVFVAGDAAHVHSPTGAQGLNSSIQDSFNLGWKLALVEKGFALPSLLSTYTEERLPVIAEMLKKTSELLNKTVKIKADGQDTSAWHRGGLLLQLGVNYRWSSIVVDERADATIDDKQTLMSNAYEGGHGIRAGDRAPDASGLLHILKGDNTGGTLEPITLFQIFRPSRHTVLLFMDDSSEVNSLLGRLKVYPRELIHHVVICPKAGRNTSMSVDSADTLVDEHGYAYEGYSVPRQQSTIVIVRPDGVIGGITLGSAGLETYFRGIFSAIPTGQ